MANVTGVTKKGLHQRGIITLIGHSGALTWTQLLRRTGMEQRQLSIALRALVAAGALVHEWDEKGRAVYRLPRRDDVC